MEDGGRSISFVARDVPSLGWRAYRLAAGAGTGWTAVDGVAIANGHYRLVVDPARGGGVESLVLDGRELIADGRVGNELAVYEEYPSHPSAGEGPWHLLPKGPVIVSSASPAQVQAYRSPLGERLVIRGHIGDDLRYTQTADPVGRGGPGRLSHRGRRVQRCRSAREAALAVSGARCLAGQ